MSIKFSVLVPVYNVEKKWLELAVESVKRQTYQNWELCLVDDCSTDPEVRKNLEQLRSDKIRVKFLEKNGGISAATNEAAKMAEGEYLVLMDNDDELNCQALEKFAAAIEQTGAEILYSDQDIVDTEGGHREPLCKPDWSQDLLLSQMYIGHLLGFKKTLFEKAGGFRSEYNGSQDYDLMLRMSELTDHIVHVPEILYSWRAIPSSTAVNPESKPYAQVVGLKAIQDHLDRVYGSGEAKAEETENYFVYDVRYRLEEQPLVSVIIPTKDHADLLKGAIDSIFEKTEYSNYEILILDNNSEEKETFAYFEQVVKEHENVRVEKAAFPFNWSRLNNFGMEKAKGDIFLFLNNDVKVIAPEWMTRLAEKAVRKGIGVVGGLLLYEDGTIQHAGVVAGMGGWGDHVFKGMQPVHYGSPFVSPMVTRNVTAVTGACMAISRETIEKIGVFDENFIICGSDVEICVRAIQKGYRNVYDPYVKLYHFESKSRDSYIPPVDFEMSDKMYQVYREKGDPYFNRQLDSYSCVPRMAEKESRDVVQVEKKEGILEKLKRKYRQMSRNTEPVTQEKEQPVDTHIAEINPYTFRKVEYPRKRINLLLPSINPEHVFGGISTALKFFEKLADELGYDRRIILVDAVPGEETRAKYRDRYTFAEWNEECQEKNQIVPYAYRSQCTLPVSEKDYFMFTGWWTAHCTQEAYEDFQEKTGIAPNPFINFIQDYEPGFYAWSTRFLLADATYKNEYPQIAVFNTRLLQEYFHNNGYQFAWEFAFDPVLNGQLKSCLDQLGTSIQKKKQILVYGRPGTERNAFKLIVAALRRWVEQQQDIEEWTILSAGEQHAKVDLGRGKYLQSVGKLTLQEYAKTLEESYAGISLMASPHPSYPPLEMSVFGVKVITNTFANKDLKDFTSNILPFNNISPSHIAKELKKICDNYRMIVPHEMTNQEYCDNENVFDFIKEIKQILNKDA